MAIWTKTYTPWNVRIKWTSIQPASIYIEWNLVCTTAKKVLLCILTSLVFSSCHSCVHFFIGVFIIIRQSQSTNKFPLWKCQNSNNMSLVMNLQWNWQHFRIHIINKMKQKTHKKETSKMFKKKERKKKFNVNNNQVARTIRWIWMPKISYIYMRNEVIHTLRGFLSILSDWIGGVWRLEHSVHDLMLHKKAFIRIFSIIISSHVNTGKTLGCIGENK